MRKIYKLAGFICLGLVLSSQNTIAQTVSDFENLTLTPNSYWDGSDRSGTHNAGLFSSTFSSGDANFNNVYDTTYSAAYGYWSKGFAYTNMTDSTTSGSGNMYSAKTASGVNNSANYLISSNNSIIHLTSAAANNTVKGVYITNTTYAANSMRDGDSFAKKFGGTTGNDPDWFKLTIWGYTNGNLTPDSVEFYLADYRFSNNAQDYIVKNWQWVNLTTLGAIDSVKFILTSSDNGSFGMNTPAFFALDNFNDQTVGVGVKEVATLAKIDFYPNPTTDNFNVVVTANNTTLSVIDITGKTVLYQSNLNTGIHHFNIANLKKGVYFIRIISNNKMKTAKLIKA